MPPNTAKPRNGINHRKAKAGRLLLENPAKSTKAALIEAGYAKGTARMPKEKGLGADVCIAEAVKNDPSIDPAKILECTRRVLYDRLQDPETVSKARLGELSRLTEVTERWYGGHTRDVAGEARDFVDRAQMLSAILKELERRDVITVNKGSGLSPSESTDNE